MLRIFRLFIGGLALYWIVIPVMTFGAPVKGVLNRPAIKARMPSSCVLIDITYANSRLVAAGERGIIIYSDDSGKTWQQSDVPVSVSITAVYFTGSQKGWAVGHGGVVLHTADGGKTWHKQFDGIIAAQKALENAKTHAEIVGSEDFETQQMVNNATLLVKDGPDKPFLDLYFRNDREGFIIGSYGLIFRTDDGGTSWNCIMDKVENPDGLNLYSMHVHDDAMYIAGEQGLFLVSEDGGNSFKRIETPYIGTYFDLAVLPTGEIILVGLNGSAYCSVDHGQTFSKSNVEVPVSFSGVMHLTDGTLLFSNQGGMLLKSLDRGKTIKLIDVARVPPISSFVPMNNDIVMTVGLGGAIPVKLPSQVLKDAGGQP